MVIMMMINGDDDDNYYYYYCNDMGVSNLLVHCIKSLILVMMMMSLNSQARWLNSLRKGQHSSSAQGS